MNIQKMRLFIHRPPHSLRLAIPLTRWYNLQKEKWVVFERKKRDFCIFFGWEATIQNF